jgi:hypothetical protein
VLKWAKAMQATSSRFSYSNRESTINGLPKKARNDGKHPWKIPASVTTGNGYAIKITSRTKKTVTDTSNSTFTITNASGGDDDDDDSLELISPNGGESWKKGDVVSIEWAHINRD